jgi:superfamily II DNA/RNA helicase
MYRQFNHGRQGFGRSFKRRSFGAERRIKSFDPTRLIASTTTTSESVQNIEYVAKNTFLDFKIHEDLKSNISQKGYKIPTPVQDQAIPSILEGKDLIGIANTGTGKTAAFLIPLINKVILDKNQKVLIITPTRELAAQIKDEFIDFSRGMGIYCTLCIGGAHIGRQKMDLSRNPSFVVGTPGRIKDLIRTNNLNLSNFSSIVLDEADRMVDIGFINDIKYIVSLLRKDRQSLFFSATIDGRVREIIQDFVQNPVTVSVKTGDVAQNINQTVVRVHDSSKKIDQLHDLLSQKAFEKVLVFGRTKRGVQKLAEELTKRGFKSDAIHGNKRQNQRIKTLDNFKRNNIQILIATDVAARGLDIPDVSHVINYDLPESQDAYSHRIGRTGRAGKRGFALTFID